VRNARGLINHYAEHAGFASAAQLHFHRLQSTGSRYPFRNLANFIDLKHHEINTLELPAFDVKAAETKKWACAHWCVSPNAGNYTTVLKHEYTPFVGKRQTAQAPVSK
jgi:hypothetical protein